MIFISPSMTDSSAAVAESDLVTPALLVLAKVDQDEATAGIPSRSRSGLPASALIAALEQLCTFSPADQAITPGDHEPRLRRQVRNLLSHQSMERDGLVGTSLKQGATCWRITVRGKAALAEKMIRAMGSPATTTLSSVKGRTLEASIAKPALYMLTLLEGLTGAPVSMSLLRQSLRASLPRSAEDLAGLAGRKDTRLDQVIRNLVSNDTLKRQGWIVRSAKGMSVTDVGKAALLEEMLKPIPSPVPAIKRQRRHTL